MCTLSLDRFGAFAFSTFQFRCILELWLWSHRPFHSNGNVMQPINGVTQPNEHQIKMWFIFRSCQNIFSCTTLNSISRCVNNTRALYIFFLLFLYIAFTYRLDIRMWIEWFNMHRFSLARAIYARLKDISKTFFGRLFFIRFGFGLSVLPVCICDVCDAIPTKCRLKWP